MREEFTVILNKIDEGNANADDLLPLIYDELRRMAASRMAWEASDHTLQATALVHEAWIRLGGSNLQQWENRAHFFGAASEAMRRILVDHARKKKSMKRGGGASVDEFDEEVHIPLAADPDELLAVNDALETLVIDDPKAAELVKLRYFVGMTMEEAANALEMKKRSAEALWTYARIQLQKAIQAAR